MATKKKPSGARKAKAAAGAAPKRAAARKPAARRAAAAKKAARPAAKVATKVAAKKPSRVAPSRPKPGAKAGKGRAAKGAVTLAAAKGGPKGAPVDAPDPEGFFVARVRGEEEARHAPHPMTETPAEGSARWTEQGRPWEGSNPVLPVYDEHLGDLPWAYGDDAFIALPRDPRTLFFYWDLSEATVRAGFEGLDGAHAQLWVLAARAEGWEQVRVLGFALESRSFYVNELEPGRTYRGEIQAVDRHGYARRVGPSSNAVALPTVGPSPEIEDRFARIPWDLPLPRLLGRGQAGGPFSEDLRALLARLSDWGRFPDRPWGGSAAGGARPSSPAFAPSFFPEAPSGRDGKE